jgi:hypothetical protein
MIDSFSTYVYLEAVKDVTMETTAKALVKRIFPNHPEWRGIISDRATSFKNKGLQLLNKMTGVKHFFSSSLHPQGHGIIERMVLEVNRLLPKYTTEDNIEQVLPLLEYILHVNINTSLGYSPHEILRGSQPPLFLNADIIKKDTIETKPPSQYIFWLKERLKLVLDDVQRNVLKARTKQKAEFDKRNKVTQPSFVEGDRVWLEKKRADHKKFANTHQIFRGPYYITKIVSRSSTFQPSTEEPFPNLTQTAIVPAYELTDCKTGKTLKSLIPACRLKAYISATDFELKHPPLQKNGSEDQEDQGQLNSETNDSGNENSQPTQHPWETAKNIVRIRNMKGKVDYLVRFEDSSVYWCEQNDVSEELIRKFHLKQATVRRNRRRWTRDVFKDG